jgi:DNA-binding CsgD family transcriptional regulator
MLDERVRNRIIAETRGNPLALLELPRGLTATQLAGGFALPSDQPLSGRIEETFVRRLEMLSDDARRLVLLAAAEPIGDPLLLARAAERLEIAASAVNAETDGLLAIGERVTFRHPLVRSAVYRWAEVHERRAVHLALAETTDARIDPDRRAWHLAAAAAGPDENVALELERSAARAQARGGLAAGAVFLQRAVALTEDPERRTERALVAAQASLQAGSFDEAVRLLVVAEAAALDASQLARVELARGHAALASGLVAGAPPLLLEAARRLAAFDLELARETYLTASVAASIGGQGDVVAEIWRAVRALPSPPGTPRPLDLLVDGLALLAIQGHAAATPTLQQAAKALADIPVEDVLRWGWAATGPSASVWDDEGYCAISARLVRLVRQAGALAQLPIHLSSLAVASALIGDFAAAASLVAEVDSVVAATRSEFPLNAATRLQALQGKEAETAAAVASAIEQVGAGGPGMAASWAHWSAAVLYNGLARYEDAASAARQAASSPFDPWAAMWALPELVEAAVRTGDADAARDALERLAGTTGPSGTAWALGIEARSRALLTDGDDADALYREAINLLGRTRLRPEIARSHLLYGEWLRRENRRVDARRQLRTAYDQLTSIGMEAFAERARLELQATGENVRRRTAATRDDLTPQERQIAWLARDGLSNPEIGARLFVSPRTVEWHLRNVFTKLAIRSRRELSHALPNSGSQSV